MIKRLSLTLALALLLCAVSVPALARGSYLGNLRVVNCSEWVTLRAHPDTDAPAVTRVPLGATVEAYYFDTEFVECYYLGMHGFILSAYLSKGSSGSQSGGSSYLGKLTVVNCKEFVTLRSYASTSAPSITKIARGQQVDAYYYNGTFCRCFYNGLEGYILSQYLGDHDDHYESNNFMGYMTIVNCNDWVTLRAAPSTKAGTVTRVPWGATVEAYAYNSQFAECYYLGMHGFILLKYLG